MDFTKYFLMNAKDASEYVRQKLDYFDKNAELSSAEIGDGNLNYVFRVTDGNKSIIVKQAGPELRIAKSLHASIDRGYIESEILKIQNECAPGSVPEVFLYDSVMKAIIEEDMVGHKMMRTALLNREIFPKFAEQITDFMVNSLLKTTDVCMEHKAKKEAVRKFINPMLCEITEDLVYSEPYDDYNHRNNVFPENAEFVRRELYEDNTLKLEAAKLKFDFMNNAQSLIHGDLHTGSIFINKEHTFVFDPEFACFAPMGYDVGNIIANMFFAYCSGSAALAAGEDCVLFTEWCFSCIRDIFDLFFKKFSACWDENVSDSTAKTPGFKRYYTAAVMSDTAATVGLECIRRTVGLANVKDITSIENPEIRKLTERIIILFAKDCIINRNRFKVGADLLEAIMNASNAAREWAENE